MKNESKEPVISFTPFQLLRLDNEALGHLISERIQELRWAHPPKVKIDQWKDITPMDQFVDWFRKLPREHFASFFTATSWPPKIEKKEESKRKRSAPAIRSRSKPKPKAKPAAKAKAAPKPKASAKTRAKQLVLPTDDPKAKPKTSRLATGDELAGDLNTREVLLAFVRGAPEGVTAAAIQEHVILSPGQTKGLLKRLREQGAIRVEGKNRGAKYFAGAGKAKGKDEEE